MACLRAAEAALADAYQFSGGSLPGEGLVLGRGCASFRVVRFGGHKVRKALGNAADAVDAADVFLYQDSSIAPLLDMRRRFKAVMDVLDAMIRYGLSRSVELTAQWDRILAIGHLYPVTLDDLYVVWGVGVVSFIVLFLMFIVVLVISFMRLLFIGGMRLLGSGGIGFGKTPMVHPYRWLRPDLVRPAPFLQCEPHLTPGGSGVLSDPARIDEEFRKDFLPYFCRSEASLEEFDREVEGWTPKTDGDATPLGQRPLSVLPVIYRVWASAWMGQLDDWFRSWVPDSVFSAGGGRTSVEAWYATALDIEEVLAGAADSHIHLFVADVIKSFDTVDRTVLDRVLSSLGLPGWFRHAYFEYHSPVRMRFKLASGLGEPWTRDGGYSSRLSIEYDVYRCFVSSLV